MEIEKWKSGRFAGRGLSKRKEKKDRAMPKKKKRRKIKSQKLTTTPSNLVERVPVQVA